MGSIPVAMVMSSHQILEQDIHPQSLRLTRLLSLLGRQMEYEFGWVDVVDATLWGGRENVGFHIIIAPCRGEESRPCRAPLLVFFAVQLL